MCQSPTLEEIQKKALDSGNWEPLREYYRPEQIRLLLVANAAPHNRFFYLDDVKEHDGLFHAVAEAVCSSEHQMYCLTVFNDSMRIAQKREILELFKMKGIYLMDILPKTKDKAIKEATLSYWLDEFKKHVFEQPISKDCVVVLCHNNAHKLKSFFIDHKFDTEKLPCPVQQNGCFLGQKGTFITKLSKIYQKIEGNEETTNAKP